MRKLLEKSLLALILLFTACGPEEFGTKKNIDDSTTDHLRTTSANQCGESTLVKPLVDFLFVWDNSGSQFSVNSATKRALNNTIALISDRFDFHILLAPLIKGSHQYFISSTPLSPSNTMEGESIIVVSNKDKASNHLANFSLAGAGTEAGMQRVVDLVKNNVSNGIFRTNAYTMIIMMSNEDDDSWAGTSGIPHLPDRDSLIDEKFQDLMCMRGNYDGNSIKRCSNNGFPNLNSLMLRFFSMVPHQNNCSKGYREGYVYKRISEKVYIAPYTNALVPPTGATAPYDSVNICDGMDDALFDGINNSIQDKVIGHKYRYWPVAQNPSASFNEKSITVFKNTGEKILPRTNVNPNGFVYIGGGQTVNTRVEPTVGEPFTGHVLELFGSAQLQYPECLIVTTTTRTDYYGFVHLKSKPVESSIRLTINGVSIPKSSTNGWQLVKSGVNPRYFKRKNIKIKSPTDYAGASPGIYRSGYFLQLFGTPVYSNGVRTRAIYDPASS